MTPKGYTGKILRVDLSTGKTSTLDTMDYARKFVGGRGLATALYWDEVPPDVGAFSPENRLIIATGGAIGALARYGMGGLVQQALKTASFCSHDPVCASHKPRNRPTERWLEGAACHGCALVAETSCEMRNDYLDRALVVPTLATAGAAYFGDAR